MPLTSEQIYRNQRQEHNAEKYSQWVTTLSQTLRVYLIRSAVVASQIREIAANSPKIRTYSS